MRTAFIAAVLLAASLGAACAPDRSNQLREAIRNRLKDPESAKFRSERMSWNDDQAAPVKSLCGEVNAKNGYGGYTGFQGFISTETGSTFLQNELPSGWSAVWATWCAKPV